MTKPESVGGMGGGDPSGAAGRTAETPAAGDSVSGSGLVGTVLAGRYRIVEKLGEGAMGAVYLGEHLKIGRMDAIKVLRDSLAADPEAIARFTRGARNVGGIQHPNVCTVYDYSETDDGHQFWAMEFIPGESLRELLEREGALPLERAVEIARQTAEGLQAAHDAGIVHRDLKPANLMIAPGREGHDVVKVVDFDIAKGAQEGESEVTRLGFVIGTPEYMSPEQLIGDRVSGRSDVYSLALVLVRMLTGTLPYRAESTQDMMVQRLTGQPLTLAELLPGAHFPAALQPVLDRALARKPAERHASAAEFARELAAVLTAPGSAAAGGAPVFARGAAELTGARQAPTTVPATRLSVPPVVTAAAAGEAAEGRGASGKPPSRRWPAAAGGALALVVVAAASWTLLSTSGAEQAAETTPPVGAPSDTFTAAEPDTAAIALLPPAEDPAPARARPPPAERTPAQEELAPVRTDPPAERREPPPTAPSLTAEEANAALLRQLDLLGDGAGARPARELEAIRDTATLVWQFDGAGARNRAFAAYVLGSAWLAAGEAGQCVTWLERALSLRPDGPGFAALLENCRRQRE
ncbi:MAG: serine/threonine protein kinase [Gemmatimonadetes bacterium]|nr:serine/threonine protein kinase [Gemmatimonadota bacterium]